MIYIDYLHGRSKMNRRQKKKRLKLKYTYGYSPKVKIFTIDESIFTTYSNDLTIPDTNYPIANPVKVITLEELKNNFKERGYEQTSNKEILQEKLLLDISGT